MAPRSEVMDLEQELKRVADSYASKGYQVSLRPGPDHLPPFAKDFKVEVVGKRGSEGVLVAVKRNRDELAADTELARYADAASKQAGWRLDLVVLEGVSPLGRDARGAHDFSAEDISTSLPDAEQMARMGFVRAAVITAWAGLEAAMRMRLRAAGQKAGWGTMSREMLNELYSSGVFTPDDFRELEKALQLRNEIAHGFSSPTVDAKTVQLLGDIARRLLAESEKPHAAAG